MSEGPPSARERLRRLGEGISREYEDKRRVMSFAEYLDAVAERPGVHLRSAPQYVRDCFDFFGTEQVQYPWGEVRRFKLFDCEWSGGRERLIGQEEVQNKLYRVLDNFVHEGTANKLVLLHGPNGSAKSTLVRAIGRALQHYSSADEGVLYRINWIFPTQKSTRSGIGFSRSASELAGPSDTYAYLPDEVIDATLSDELRDHPMLLIPPGRRREIMAGLLDGRPEPESLVLSDYMQFGRLSHKNRAIYEALLSSYHGDYLKVLRHVQVERFFVDHRYREGYVTIEPQLAVDASERQITVDRSISALPAALQAVSLFEYGGELTAANRGLLEYSDLLKRPLERYKYLLSTVERASVSLQNATLYFDLVFVGTSNEIHLAAFKEIPDFQSFKGRLELVRVPYLLDVEQERLIYETRIHEAAGTRHVAPHCAYVAALWAVLTRMRKPQADQFPKEVSDVVAQLTPLEKADLYGSGRVPEALTSTQAKELLGQLDALWHESDSYPNYEGRTGASPREILGVLFNAANSATYDYVSPLAILDEIEELIKQVSVYEFLKQEPLPGGYHNFAKFVEQVRGRLAERIDQDVLSSLGMVEETEYVRVFDRYVTHVMHWTKKEKVFDEATGRAADPDESLMHEVESTLGAGTPADDFRHNLITRIGAWALENPKQKLVYREIFSDHFRRLREAYFDERKKEVRGVVESMFSVLAGEAGSLEEPDRVQAEESLARLMAEHGYTEASALDAIRLLLRDVYTD